MSERRITRQHSQYVGPLPAGWTLQGGYINYATDDYHKYILDASGRIDRNAIALTLENYGYPDHARRWFLSPAEMAANDILEALRGLFEHCAMVHKYWGDNSNLRAAESAIKNAHAAIAAAEGRE